MADNVVMNSGAGGATAATDEVNFGAGLVHVQQVKLVSGADGATDRIAGDAANGLDVDVTRLPALPAGSNNIGDVDVLTVPADPFGVNADAASATGSISAKLRFIAATGIPVTSIAAGDNNIGNVDIVTLPNVTLAAGTNTNEVVGDAAHDAPVAGNPLLCGAEARTSMPTAVANGDAVRQMADKNGRMVVTQEVPRELITQNRLALTSTTETTLIAAGGAGVFRDLTHLILSNESATECRVDIRDATGGSVVLSVDLAADGGGAVIPFAKPLKQTTANNNWTAQLSAAVSTVYITAQAADAN